MPRPFAPSRRARVRSLVLAIASAIAGARAAHAQAAPVAVNDGLFTVESGCGDAPASTTRDSMTRGPSAAAPIAKPAAASTADSSARHALVLRAAVSAREVRFRQQPRVVVRLCGATGDSVHVLERRNLPSPVVAGTTYRDVYVAVEILGHLDADCIAARLTGGAADSTKNSTASSCASLTTTRSPDR